ncbi:MULTISPECIES: RCC1 domain-containing protein [Myxococcus]|uniref:RCC1 domain-containing protein n=1 Tax=Myxococcus TaxID=32 RepID=UPI0030845ED4
MRSGPLKVSLTLASIGAGLSSSMATRADGTVWAWGSNAYGQLEDGSLVDKVSPAPTSIHSMGIGNRIASPGRESLGHRGDFV